MKKVTKDQELQKLAQLSKRELYMELRTSNNGLTSEDAKKRLEEFGENKVQAQKPTPAILLFLSGFKDPFVLVLLLLIVVSSLTGDFEAATVMIVMVFLSVGISFWQAFKSQKASLALKELIENTASVKRDNKIQEIPMEQIVPGDIVQLSTGDLIPADAILISTKDLFVNQSSLTGESMPVEKFVEANVSHETPANALDYQDLVFMGCDVLSGIGEAIILKTGPRTFFGDVAKSAMEKRGNTNFDRGLNQVSKLLLKMVAILFPIVFLLNGFTKGDWSQAFFFAIAVAVGLTPEMLPMIVTSNLAKGSQTMAKEKVIVKELAAIQNLGAMDVLCTDKTGTITEDRVVLVEHVDPLGKTDLTVADYAYLNSHFQTGWKNLMDKAVLNYFDEKKRTPAEENFKKIDEIPFDFSRRRLTVVIENEQHQLMITKGAVEEMLEVTGFAKVNGEIQPITPELLTQMTNVNQQMNEKGMRVIAVAIKENVHTNPTYSASDESAMILVGFVGFLDPAKKSAKSAISDLQRHGVTVKVLTGDNPIVAKKVCLDVGIPVDRALTGADIDQMTAEELSQAVKDYHLFAKLNPMQKSQLIEVLQKNGSTVGYMGDGINDAPALRKADVGISVDTAADITKEASNIILLEKSLDVLEAGVLEGRKVFSNMMKYIKITISSNFGNVFSILVAAIFLPFLPMLSIQLLVQNLIYDLSQLLIPFDHVDKEELAKPVKWELTGLVKFTLTIGPVSSIFDLLTFAVMWFVFSANTVGEQALFQTGWFMIGITTQTLVFHIVRTKKLPFLKSIASLPVLLGSVGAIGLAFILVLTPLGTFIDFTSLPTNYWPWYFLIVLSYLVVTELAKRLYIKMEGGWL
ncbi:magnesium-translocating P-type ATPase [Enterococcus timonensis]|uniref:magnesium-translocating P-type ATPase n=1 Tax=Enterococcus timonensis TaxID=1852364 RepID=UPI000AC3445E|nr:magnesium-translocating P-type ATPase [Enterococcus timonensis]